MKRRESTLDSLWYGIAILLTLGGAFIIRVIISEGIRQATERDKNAV
jgi:ABC-type microcin C transport system permease subunit YejE